MYGLMLAAARSPYLQGSAVLSISAVVLWGERSLVFTSEERTWAGLVVASAKAQNQFCRLFPEC